MFNSINKFLKSKKQLSNILVKKHFPNDKVNPGLLNYRLPITESTKFLYNPDDSTKTVYNFFDML